MSENLREKRASLREMATDAIRYWEPRRLIYNAVLGAVVTGYFIAAWPQSRAAVSMNAVLVLFILGVLANVCYTAAYLPDIFLQFSGYRAVWVRWRGLLLFLGIAFAAAITRFFALGFFISPAGH
jgi:hypothetical protein